ncbi:D(2) dopamine receptor isoform X2 [Rhinatrema bivittatum]|uniref:D(2) dopamine receptor isoform X2 n=1 Tax=Rhinatrema bivittatum TaxID=194408 RepID=UPI00112A1612|nr:D(2) dopamine receptor isoform X2 [Rhinatrema bivittatum]
MDSLNLSLYNEEINNRTNGTEVGQKFHYNYYAMLLTLLIFVIVFGNVLVCMAVSREKALQTTTNYLIVSLAVADLLVATLVMPWMVYLEVVGEWKFSRIHCDIFVTLDVMMCTASILNLCAISIDRYTAVAMPMLYNTRYSSKRRVTVMIAVVWVLSFAISCPLLFGLNKTEINNECIIANPAFVVYSSIVSFYVPFIVTLLVYVQIYIVLRKRRKRVNTKRNCHGLESEMQEPRKEAVNHPEEMEMEMMSSTTPPEKMKNKPTSPNNHLVLPATSNQCKHTTVSSPIDCMVKAEKNGHAQDNPKTAKAFETQAMPNGKTRTSIKTMSKRKLSQQKEKKATQMLAIVLGVFIICWLPFFITHILNIHCDCNIPPALYSAFTWLGYVNSAVNPIIYTTFNIEFRKAFIKILHC